MDYRRCTGYSESIWRKDNNSTLDLIEQPKRDIEEICAGTGNRKVKKGWPAMVVIVPERGKDRIEKPNRATLQHIIDQGSQYRGKLHAKTRYTRPN